MAPVSNITMWKPLAIFSLLVVAVPCVAAENDASDWGPTVDGLRLSVALLSGSPAGSRVRVTVNYTGDKPLLLPFAFINGDLMSRYRPQLLVTTTEGQHSFIFDGLDAIFGRDDPLVVPMAPNASYTLELPFAEWHDSHGNTIRLQKYVHQQGQLWVEWNCAYHGTTTSPPSLPCPLYGYPNPNQITCWEGKLISNKLTLPQ